MAKIIFHFQLHFTGGMIFTKRLLILSFTGISKFEMGKLMKNIQKVKIYDGLRTINLNFVDSIKIMIIQESL